MNPGYRLERRYTHDTIINRENSKRILEDFVKFCKVDKQLEPITYRGHLRLAKKIVRYLLERKTQPSRETIREFLNQHLDKAPNTYRNYLKTVRAFLGDYLRFEWASEFEFPRIEEKEKWVPEDREIRQFYKALRDDRERSLYLLYATSGLRKEEIRTLEIESVDLENRTIRPNKKNSTTKRRGLSFYNEEAEKDLNKYLATRKTKSKRLIAIGNDAFLEMWREAQKKTGLPITPRVLRRWFSTKMGELGVPDRYIDIFQGRSPRSVIAKHYTGKEFERLKRIYDRAHLRVLSEET